MNPRMKFAAVLGLSALFAAFSTTLVTADHHDEKKKDKDEAKTAEVGKTAPKFELKDTEGNTHKLSDYEGKTVILEWFNGDCPYVVRHYERGFLKEFANKTHAKEEYVWIAINSNPEGTQGGGRERSAYHRERYNIEFPILIDENNRVAHKYKASRTPEIYIINPEGVLVYQGAVDNDPHGRLWETDEYVNYVENALKKLKEDEAISPDRTRAYGCRVRYAS